ncbi:unnamed protein product [Heligmosomoides polygyrus]|uniref:Uncharacterized protein n=1 Tax=Heligmosomoides polygyrus TaxID=6339 RepID=A0A183FRY9_HELPZ|nr:unnamed protein product [Heligmosomoides polygyrus]
MTLFVSLERGGSIGPLWHATGTNGDAAGARLNKSTINGTTGDTGKPVHREVHIHHSGFSNKLRTSPNADPLAMPLASPPETNEFLSIQE